MIKLKRTDNFRANCRQTKNNTQFDLLHLLDVSQNKKLLFNLFGVCLIHKTRTAKKKECVFFSSSFFGQLLTVRMKIDRNIKEPNEDRLVRIDRGTKIMVLIWINYFSWMHHQAPLSFKTNYCLFVAYLNTLGKSQAYFNRNGHTIFTCVICTLQKPVCAHSTHHIAHCVECSTLDNNKKVLRVVFCLFIFDTSFSTRSP